MEIKIPNIVRLFKSRLSRRISYGVFVGFAIIEILLLVPSVLKRESEILEQSRQITQGKIEWIANNFPNASGLELLAQVQQLQSDVMLRQISGGTIYESGGKEVGKFGESPTMSYADIKLRGYANLSTRYGDRYDAAWLVPTSKNNYVIVIRHNIDYIYIQLTIYVLGIIGSVLIIAIFLTLTIMLIVGEGVTRI